ncbi:MAG: PAS domain S-box protein, partial [Gammaproteobacteria bacterium]|nr:PAS domain S-box protein [Gammaproteobacteria bacterium]
MSALESQHSPLARRLVIYTILFSSLITLVLTVIQLHREYRLDLDAIETHFSLTKEAHLQPLREALWTTNRDSVRLQLEGILQFPDMQYAEIRENGEVWISAGEEKATNVLTRTYPITRRHRGQELTIGVLSVVASLDGVYRRIIDRAVVILISNGLKTFLVALFILFLVHRLFTRHVIHIAEHVSGHADGTPADSIRLQRATGRGKDELDHLVESINQMRERVSESMMELRASEARYRDLVALTSDWQWEQDADGRFTHFPKEEGQLIDVDADYVRGKRREDLPGAEPDSGSWDDYLETVRQRLPIRDFRYSVLNSRGERRHMIINGAPVFDEDGNFQGYRGTVRDDTEKAEAEWRAEREHIRLVDAIESLADGFVLFDASDHVLMSNRAYRALTGIGDDTDLTGKSYVELLKLLISEGMVDPGDKDEEAWIAWRLEQRHDPTGPYETK